ncbi:MAG: SusC/RagA family TonB-linked outer membrane protein [Chitinophagaceae bacterium]|nr:SusC/RagA family TonB-linked outer membrane protein [Chitinophagaceae bacterium]
MRKVLRKTVLVLVAFTLPLILLAQVNVSGTIADARNNPVSGASIKLRNSTTGTTTDANGKFSLTVPGTGGTLEISSVGYQPQTIQVSSNSNQLTITLTDDISNLNEVVITGLATGMKRTNLAHAVATVSAKSLTGTTVQPSLDGALYGKFSGANISANSGAPGGGISIKLRGITSLVASSQPLFIVDGVYYDNSSIQAGLNLISKAAGQGSTDFQDNPSNRVADLDPEDIERVEILKGASAAAIYGSRAAGGVVLITTKRGKPGTPKIELSHSIGVQMQLNKLGQRQWDTAKVRAAYGAARVPLFQSANGQTFDYEDELYGNKGIMNNTRLSVSGGNESTHYYAGITRKDDEGIIKGTGYEKTSFRLNVDQKITSFLDLSLNSNYVTSEADRGFFNNDNTSTTLGVSFVSTPSWVNLFSDANGNYPNNPLAPSNFLQTRDLITNRERVNRFLLGSSVTWKVYNDEKHDIRIIGRGGIDYYTLNTIAIFPRELQFQKNGNGTNGASIYGTTITRNSNYNAFIVHNFTPNERLNFRTQAGVTAENVDQDNVVTTATQLIGTQTNVNQAGSVAVTQAKSIQHDRGFFIQEEFNYNDLLLLTAGLRGDKSSRNGDANKLYYYPKGSVAFNIHQLAAWNLPAINQLKIRAAYGQSGNFAPFGAIYSPLVPAIFNGNTGSLIGLTRGNPALQPEKQKELETGLDVSFLRNRITLEFTYYTKEVEDLILDVEIPSSSGFTKEWKNVANIRNRGIEIGLMAIPVSTNDLKWTSQVLFWKNKAKVTRLDVPAFNTGAFGATLGTYRIEQGKSPTQLVGIGTTDQKPDPTTGLVVFDDAEPDFNLSFLNNVTWKNFELSVLMHWKKGGSNVNLSTLLADIFGTSPDFDKKTLDPAGVATNGAYRLGILGSSAAPWIEDASYFRVRELGLSYRIPKTVLKNIAAVRVGISARNLINIFDYSSYDPEVSNFGADAISSNVEVTPFPSSKSFHFNIAFTF